MLLVVSKLQALPVADDGTGAANRTEPREQLQRDLGHPSLGLFRFGQCYKQQQAVGKLSVDRPAKDDQRLSLTSW